MKKRLYNSPLVEVMKVETVLMQHLQGQSNGEFPGGPGGAPIRGDIIP